MGEQIVSLRKDIEIHKQVENELAKRSHFCQKVIKKLNAKMKELKDQLAEAKSKKKNPLLANKQLAKSGEESKQKNNEELIQFLQSKIDEIEKKQQTVTKVSSLIKGI